MRNLSFIKNSSFIFLFIIIFVFIVNTPHSAFCQTLRNPVLEFCTGTWCPWCPCGKNLIIEEILPTFPNAIILAYHGYPPADPFSNFDGSDIRSAMSFSAYPTGVIDRVTGIANYYGETNWLYWMIVRASVQATVEIQLMRRGYNPITQEFKGIIEFKALEDLSGEFNFTVILTEDGIVYPQSSNNTCTPGISYMPDYHHNWLVRDMMNGSHGEQLVNGEWKKDEIITKTIERIVPPIPDNIPAINKDSCNIVILVHKVGSPLNSNAEIQQAAQWPMLTGEYKSTISQSDHEIFSSQMEPVEMTTTVKNIGVKADTFRVEFDFSGPDGWSQSYTTTNGTFPFTHSDEFILQPDDSTTVTIELHPNSIPGVGETNFEFLTSNFVAGSAAWKFVTYGLDVLVVDDEVDQNEDFAVEALDLLNKNYGVVSSRLVPSAVESINSFDKIFWMCAATEPTLTIDEQDVIKTYLDNGGNLYLSGADIAYELADPTSPSYSENSLDFLTEYIHASYVKRDYDGTIIEKIEGDIITGEIGPFGLRGGTGASTINPLENKYPNQILPADANAFPIFQYFPKTNDYPAIRAIHYSTTDTAKIVFTTFGFESISKTPERNTFAEKIIQWFETKTTSIKNINDTEFISHFQLQQNYPNPFNPKTTIAYTLPAKAQSQQVQLTIYNQLGQKIRTLVNGKQNTGHYVVNWDGLNDRGEPVVSGVYIYKIHTDHYKAAKKLLLLR